MIPDNSIGFGSDPLFDFELRIARRADELAKRSAPEGAGSLQCWLLAEHEILRELDAASPVAEIARAAEREAMV